MTQLRAVAFAAVTAAAFGTAACSSSDDSGSASTSSSGNSSSSSAQTSSGSSSASSSAAASKGGTPATRSALLRQSDLPSGWTVQPAGGQSSVKTDQQINAAIASCTGVPAPPAISDSGQASQYFTKGDNLIESRARPARDLAARRAFLTAVVASPKAGQCAAAALTTSFRQVAQGATIANASATVANRAKGQPDDVVATFLYRAKVTVQGDSRNITATTVNILGDTVEAELDFQVFGAAIPADVVDKAITVVGERVAKS